MKERRTAGSVSYTHLDVYKRQLAGHMDMLTGETVKAGDMLAKYDVRIVRVEDSASQE